MSGSIAMVLLACGQLAAAGFQSGSMQRLVSGVPADTLRAAISAERADSQPRVNQQFTFDAGRFDSLTAASLRQLLDSASRRGLPVAPLIGRALEGAARRVGGARILLVVREYSNALESARESLGPESSVAELDAGAAALRSGIEPRALAAIRSSRPPGSAVMPLMVITDIVTRGVPAETARHAVTSIARMPRSDEALMGLQVTVAKNQLRGPGMALEAVQRYLRGTVPSSGSPPAPAAVDRKLVRPPSS